MIAVSPTVTGAISGIPTATLPSTDFTVTATKGTFVHTAGLRIDVAPALPAGVTRVPLRMRVEQLVDTPPPAVAAHAASRLRLRVRA